MFAEPCFSKQITQTATSSVMRHLQYCQKFDRILNNLNLINIFALLRNFRERISQKLFLKHQKSQHVFIMEKVRNEKQSEKLNRKLSSDFYPVCWQDDERMDNLFAPFRSKTVNPVNYETKLKFWKNLIKEYGKETGSSVITINALRDAFLRNGQKPHCLHTVIEDQLNDGSIKRKEQFMQPPQHTWTGWAVHALIKSPLQWGFVKVKERIIPTAMGTSSSSSADDKNRFDNIEFVIIDVVKVSTTKNIRFHYL